MKCCKGEDGYTAAARITGARLYTGPFRNRSLLGGFDVIYDNVGSARTVQDGLRWARAGGTLVLVGVSLERMRADLTPVWGQEVNLIGTMAHGMETWNGARRSTYDLTCELLLQGRLKTAGLVTAPLPAGAMEASRHAPPWISAAAPSRWCSITERPPNRPRDPLECGGTAFQTIAAGVK